MATSERAINMGAFEMEYAPYDTGRGMGETAREVAYAVEDAVLDFLWALKAGFLAIPEIAMVRAGTIEGRSIEGLTMREKVLSGVIFGTTLAAMVAVAILAG